MKRFIAIVLGCAWGIGANACSVCIAHALGAALHGLGAQTLMKGKVVVGLSYLSFSKSNASETPGVEEHERYRQTSIEGLYGLTDEVMLELSIPMVDKRIEADGEVEKASGLGDVMLGVTYQIKPTPKQKVLTALTFDVKLPTGSDNSRDSAGQLKDQHAQLGTGSTDLSLGALFTMEDASKAHGLYYGALQGRINGKNGRGFHYGDVLLYSLGYSLPIQKESALAVELNGRIAGKDTNEEGRRDDNSGGNLTYLSLSFRQTLGNGFGLGLTYQLPVLKRLNGIQNEQPLISISLSKLF